MSFFVPSTVPAAMPSESAPELPSATLSCGKGFISHSHASIVGVRVKRAMDRVQRVSEAARQAAANMEDQILEGAPDTLVPRWAGAEAQAAVSAQAVAAVVSTVERAAAAPSPEVQAVHVGTEMTAPNTEGTHADEICLAKTEASDILRRNEARRQQRLAEAHRQLHTPSGGLD